MTNTNMTLKTAKVIGQLRFIGKRLAAGHFETISSDGSRHPSKQATGKLFKLGATKTGLRLYVQVGDKVRLMNWRMDAKTVSQVLTYVYQNAYVAGTRTHRNAV